MSAQILVIDDSETFRKQVGSAIFAMGFDVVEACQGAEALEKMASNEEIKLVFCDVNMPVMSGIEFLEQLRARGGHGSTVPVVMLTTEGNPTLVQQARALGARGWLVKPFRRETLTATVSKLLK